jgi:hypothetical protein
VPRRRDLGLPEARTCPAGPPNQGPRYNPFPGQFALIPKLSSLYLVNVGGDNILSVINPSRCDAHHTSGCRREAPSVPDQEFLTTVDPATGTIYAGNLNLPQIDVINGATCNAKRLSGCAPVAEIPMADPFANVGAVDSATHTLYASDPFSDSVAVINTATCNATHIAGCGHHPPVMTIGPAPGPPALNAATQSLYVPYGNAANRVAVLNAATCNAQRTSGCGQAPAVVKVGQGTLLLAVSTATDTVYAPAIGPFSAPFSGDTVAVINGAACNGTTHSGCGHLPATIKVGLGPLLVPPPRLNAKLSKPPTTSSPTTCPNGTTTPDCSAGSPTCEPSASKKGYAQ